MNFSFKESNHEMSSQDEITVESSSSLHILL